MTTSDGSARNLADTNAQPAPERNDKPAVWSLVMRDMTERDIFGAEKYGTRLQPGNGRDFLLDAYQEALDLVVYLRGAIYERDEMATVKESLTVHPIHPAMFDHIDPADVDIASEIDDDSERMQAIGPNGNGGEHYGAPDWSKAPDNAVAYIDWSDSAARFASAFYSDGGDRFYRLDDGIPTRQYVLKLDDGRMDIDYPYFMRNAK